MAPAFPSPPLSRRPHNLTAMACFMSLAALRLITISASAPRSLRIPRSPATRSPPPIRSRAIPSSRQPHSTLPPPPSRTPDGTTTARAEQPVAPASSLGNQAKIRALLDAQSCGQWLLTKNKVADPKRAGQSVFRLLLTTSYIRSSCVRSWSLNRFLGRRPPGNSPPVDPWPSPASQRQDHRRY